MNITRWKNYQLHISIRDDEPRFYHIGQYNQY